jgi:uncharacterized protein with NRDE domain
LKVKQYREALDIAVKNGDPNNINKVISAILDLLKKPGSVTADQQPVNTV